MKKCFCIVLLTLSLFGFVFSAKSGTLTEIVKPDCFTLGDCGVFILESGTIYKYSVENLTLTGKFCRQGEGPGEIKISDYYAGSIIVLPDSVFVDSFDKILYFSERGKLIKERKKRGLSVSRMLPVGKNFAAIELDRSNSKKEVFVLSVYDSEMKKIKELYRQKSPVQGLCTAMVPDSLHFCVVNDKIFVEESPKGFFIEVFDEQGDKLYQIEKEYKKAEVTDRDKEEILRRYKEDPIVKKIGFEFLKKRIKFVYPDYYPVIQGIKGFSNELYARTHIIRDNKEEYVVMDLKGKTLGKMYMPAMEKASVIAMINGKDKRLCSIYKNKFYYLKENGEEEWELHSEEIAYRK